MKSTYHTFDITEKLIVKERQCQKDHHQLCYKSISVQSHSLYIDFFRKIKVLGYDNTNVSTIQTFGTTLSI